MFEDLLRDQAKKVGLALTPDEISKFKTYMQELVSWNQKMNLTSITGESDIINKHFIDSLLTLKAFPIKDQSIIDIGAGAGFPGIPIKIVRPDIDLCLVDSVKKKTNFMKHLVKTLDLDRTTVVCGRAEDAAKDHRERFDVAISRALAPMNVMLEYCAPLVRTGGFVVALKGNDVEGEISLAKNAMMVLGGELKEVSKVELPSTDIVRSIVVVKKIKETPDAYPRRAGMAKKKPL